jgi:hypothetical protein
MTYQQEKAAKDAEKARKARKYIYEPVLFDTIDPPKMGLEPGTTVVKIQPHGCPRNGIMGFTYVGHPETGAFFGMVRLASLTPAKGS